MSNLHQNEYYDSDRSHHSEPMFSSVQLIKTLRRELREAGAQTFTGYSPWPGCVNILVFPPEIVEPVGPGSFILGFRVYRDRKTVASKGYT